MVDVSDPGLLSSIPNWMQVIANVAVAATVAAASVFTYFKTKSTSAPAPTVITATEDHGMINQFMAKALEIMERTAIAQEQTAESAEKIAELMHRHAEDEEIEHRVQERMRARRSEEDRQSGTKAYKNPTERT